MAIDSSESIDSFESVYLVIGGDHGQGKFRSVMKVILRNRYGKNVNHFCIKVNHIDCEKDTYEVLKKSIAAPLNADIKFINESKHIQVLTDIITKEVSLFIGTEDQVDMSQYIIKKSIPVRILMCGDLAFFAAVLGKVNMSGKWCVWCQLGPTEWGVSGHNNGEEWTIEKMNDLRCQIVRNEVVDTPGNKKSIVEKILIDAIPVDHIIFSLLHAKIGVGNKVLDSFLEWVDYRVETLSQQEIEARDAYQLALIDQKEAVSNRDSWLNQYGAELAGYRTERKHISDLVKERDDQNKLILSNIVRKELNAQSKTLTLQINVLVKTRNEVDAIVIAQNKIVKAKKRDTDNFRSTRGIHTPVRMMVENCLRKYNIDRAKYHGGQLEGTTVMRLFQNAESIFGEMKQHLIDVPTKACDKVEVNDMIKRYIELSTLLDGLFSLARTPSGEASEDICEKQKNSSSSYGKMERATIINKYVKDSWN